MRQEHEAVSSLARLSTAVLVLAFNRPLQTAQVFETIRLASPPRLYIAVDGFRMDYPDDKSKVEQVVEHMLSHIDWQCEVKTLIRERNLGCKLAISGAIDWFFENEEMGIILEDDCLPTAGFFKFCEIMLERYRDDNRVGQISGFNPLVKFDFHNASYGFSRFGPVWGWATWKRAWKEYDVLMSSWPEIVSSGTVKNFTNSRREENWRKKIFESVYRGEIDTWDYQWSYAKLINNQLTIIPEVNMVKNIGFGLDATHTKGVLDPFLLQVSEINHLKHSKYIIENKEFSQRYLDSFVFGPTKLTKVIDRIFHAK